MSSGFRLFVVSASVAATVGVLSVAPVQSQQIPQQFPSPDTRQSQLRERLTGAVQRVQDACRDELRNFCSTVTPGEGRVLLCMQAHEDKISRQCEMALFDASPTSSRPPVGSSASQRRAGATYKLTAPAAGPLDSA